MRHPEIDLKWKLPSYLVRKIESFICKCPLCALFFDNGGEGCPKCPLGNCGEGSLFLKWHYADDDNTRGYTASQIFDKVKAWQPKEE